MHQIIYGHNYFRLFGKVLGSLAELDIIHCASHSLCALPYSAVLCAALSSRRLWQEPHRQEETGSVYIFSTPSRFWRSCFSLLGAVGRKGFLPLLTVDVSAFLLGSLHPALTYVNVIDSGQNPTRKGLVFHRGLADIFSIKQSL